MALTDRQKQIKKMLDQKKTPGEVAHALGITENAVYQQRRRIREIIAAEVDQRPSPAAQQPAKAPKPRTGQRKSGPARKAQKDEPTFTPLQAIRWRKTEIETRLGAATEQRDKAVKALEAATEHLANVESRVADELARLTAAEDVLTAPAAAKKAGRNGGNAHANQAASNEPVGAFSK